MGFARFLEKIRKQDAICWERIGMDYNGDEVFNDPIEIKVRWENVEELFVNEQGEEGRSQALVYMGFMPSSGSWLYLGTIAEATGSGIPSSPVGLQGAFPIKKREAVPDIKNKATLFLAYL